MFFTCFTRFSPDVQKANAVGKQDKKAELKQMHEFVDESKKTLADRENWRRLQMLL